MAAVTAGLTPGEPTGEGRQLAIALAEEETRSPVYTRSRAQLRETQGTAR